jgi:Ca-activated chloride channel family protein
MTLLWPTSLILLALIPILIGAYLWMLRRRRRYTVRYSSLSLVRQALPPQHRIRRHLPFAFFLLALGCLIAAAARPVSIVSIPTDQTVVLLTMDVSGSMRSPDIPPNRLLAAEQAAIAFIERQKTGTQIGIVAFSTFAELVQPPTADQQNLKRAVQSLTTGRATAMGSGILTAIDAISAVDKSIPSSNTDDTNSNQAIPVPKGAYAPDIIVLLTDGVSNAGPEPMDAAQQAADRGIRIYTIGYGTPNGTLPYGGGYGGGPFGGGGGFGGPTGGRRVGIDEETLKQIASLTGGTYYSAGSANELQKVFESLPTYLITRHETQEITVFFTALGALLAFVAIYLALLWNPLP